MVVFGSEWQARHGAVRLVVAGCGSLRRGLVRHGRRGAFGLGYVRFAAVRLVGVGFGRQGELRCRVFKSGLALRGRQGTARSGPVPSGVVRQGPSRLGSVWQARRVLLSSGHVGYGRHGSVRSVMARPVMVWFGRQGSVRCCSVRSVFAGPVSVRSVVVRIGRLGQVNWGRACSVPVRSVSAWQAGCGTVWRGFVGCVRFGSGAVRLAWRVLMCWGSFSWGRDKVWRARCVLVS